MPKRPEGRPAVEQKGAGEITSAEQAPAAFTAAHEQMGAEAAEAGAEQITARVAVMEAATQVAANEEAGNADAGRAAWESAVAQRAA